MAEIIRLQASAVSGQADGSDVTTVANAGTLGGNFVPADANVPTKATVSTATVIRMAAGSALEWTDPTSPNNNTTYSFYAMADVESGAVRALCGSGRDLGKSRVFTFYRDAADKLIFRWSQSGDTPWRTVTSTGTYTGLHTYGFVYDSGVTTLYVDGVAIDAVDDEAFEDTSLNSTTLQRFHVGSYWSGDSGASITGGQLDLYESRVYDEAHNLQTTLDVVGAIAGYETEVTFRAVQTAVSIRCDVTSPMPSGTTYTYKLGTATGTYTTTHTTTDPSYLFSGLNEQTTYYVQVSSDDNAGGLDDAPEQEVITTAKADDPSGSATAPTTNSAQILYDINSGTDNTQVLLYVVAEDAATPNPLVDSATTTIAVDGVENNTGSIAVATGRYDVWAVSFNGVSYSDPLKVGDSLVVRELNFGIYSTGQRGYWKLVLEDADLSIFQPPGGVNDTFALSCTGVKTATRVIQCVSTMLPNVEVRTGRTVISGYWEVADDAEYIAWQDTVTATGVAGVLCQSETLADESPAFSGLEVPNNYSRRLADGTLPTNLRRDHCFVSGPTPASMPVAPDRTLDADLEDGVDEALIAVTDRVTSTSDGSAITSGASGSGENSFRFRKDYYGTGRNAIELQDGEDLLFDGLNFDKADGCTVRLVMEYNWTGGERDQAFTFGNGYYGNGIQARVLDNYSVGVRIATSTSPEGRPQDVEGSFTFPSRLLVPITVVYDGGRARIYSNGVEYVGGTSADPSIGSTVTAFRLWLRAEGRVRFRRLDFWEQPLTREQVAQTDEYFMRDVYGDDEDLNGALAAFASENGSPTGSGMFNDPLDDVRAACGKVVGLAGDVHVLMPCGETVAWSYGTSNFGSAGLAQYPRTIGAHGAVSAVTPMPVIDYVDPNNSSGSISLIRFGNFCTALNVEFTSSNRNFRAEGTQTASNALQDEVDVIGFVGDSRGCQLLNTIMSQLSHMVVMSAGSLNQYARSHRDFEVWNHGSRNNFVNNSTLGTSGSAEASNFFISGAENTIFHGTHVGYETGWDPDVRLSSASINLWDADAGSFTGAATDQNALDNGYSHYNYDSSGYGANTRENLLCIRDASNALQGRQGVSVRDFVLWESAGSVFTSGENVHSWHRVYQDTNRNILGGNLTGNRGFGIRFSQQTLIEADRIFTTGLGLSGGETDPEDETSKDGTLDEVRLSNLLLNGLTISRSAGGVQGYIRDLVIDKRDAVEGYVIRVDDSSGSPLASYDFPPVTRLMYDHRSVDPLEGWGVPNNSVDSSTHGNTLAAFQEIYEGALAALIDMTGGAGIEYVDSSRTCATYCTNVLGYTKADGTQTDAEELGEMLYEAFAEALRTGQDTTPYEARTIFAWVAEGHTVAGAARTAALAETEESYYGLTDYRDVPTGTPESLGSRNRGAARGRGRLEMIYAGFARSR